MVPTPELLSRKTKIFYGLGSISEVLMGNIIFSLGLQIYNVGLGMKPIYITAVLAICRIWDAFSDPIIANVSDNFHSRWGRRRPFIFIGVLIASVFCVLMWMPPSVGTAGQFTYFLITAIIYYTSYTVFTIPYHALGSELTSDYHERSSLMGYKVLFMGLGGAFILPWAYKLCFILVPGDEVRGARYVAMIFAALMIIFSLGPSLFTRERFANFNRVKISILNAIKHTLRNKPFAILFITVMAAVFGIYMVNMLGFYINLSYVYDGDKNATASMDVWYRTVFGITSVGSIPLIQYAVNKIDKKLTLIISFLISIIAFLFSWFLFNPDAPYLQLIHAFFTGPSMNALWMLSMIMIADACDLDELKTGLRREGMYSAVFSWFMKIALAGPAMLSGVILEVAGFDAERVQQTAETALRLRLAFIIIPVIFLIIAIVAISHYSLDRQKMNRIQTLLGRNVNKETGR